MNENLASLYDLQVSMLKLIDEGNRKSAERHVEYTNNILELTRKHETVSLKCRLLERKTKRLEEDVITLKSHLNQLEQKNLSRNLLFNEVPVLEKSNAELYELVQGIIEGMGLNQNEIVLKKVVRFKGKLSKPPILVELADEDMKNKVVQARRTKKKLKANEFSFKGKALGDEKNLIYVDEHLTKYNAMLAKKARNLRNSGCVKHAWVKEGVVLIKENEGEKEPVVRVVNEVIFAKYKKEEQRAAELKSGIDMEVDVSDMDEEPTISRKRMKQSPTPPTTTARASRTSNPQGLK